MLSRSLPPHDPRSADPVIDRPTALRRFWLLTIGCVGVVYGDIGTSPLYAFREAAVQAAKNGGLLSNEIYGILSLLLWALIGVVTVKYVLFLMHINNRGEGGILSLMALVQRAAGRRPGLIFTLGLIGAALFYGDAAITPAISVMSAVEGLKLITPAFENLTLPIALLILLILFSVQKNGTAKVSIFFGPIMTLWFLALGVAGIYGIFKNPDVLAALNPLYGVNFILHHGVISLIVLGAVFLVVTGAETLYADLGHFGIKPIQTAWLGLVFPCLALNYLGQGATVIAAPGTITNPFYLMLPSWALMPMVGLATLATITASQAVITGTFSLTRQAIQLGLLPRMEIRHTSGEQEGQIFMPKINTLLLLGVMFLCVLFENSSALASAYGIAVSGTMLVTTMLVFFVAWKIWRKNRLVAGLIVLPFLCVELTFFVANMLKILDGGYVPLIFAGLLVMCMMIWVRGTRYLRKKANRMTITLSDLMEKLERDTPTRINGTAIFLTSEPDLAPQALMQNLKHNKILHDRNVIVTIVNSEFPKVPDDQRISCDTLSSRMMRVIINVGYMETPDVPNALIQARRYGLNIDLDGASYFLGKRSIVSDARIGLPEWQDRIYIAMARSAATATAFYRIPNNSVVELGMQISI